MLKVCEVFACFSSIVIRKSGFAKLYLLLIDTKFLATLSVPQMLYHTYARIPVPCTIALASINGGSAKGRAYVPPHHLEHNLKSHQCIMLKHCLATSHVVKQLSRPPEPEDIAFLN